MILKLCIYCILGIVMGSLGSLILAIYENTESIEWSSFLKFPQCLKCKKKLNRKCFLPIFGLLFQKNKCNFCKKRICIIKPILEVLTAILFCLIGYYCGELHVLTMCFWMLTSRILLLVSTCDIVRYEVHIPLIIFGVLLVILMLVFGIYEWSILWGAVVFFLVFLVLYYGGLFYTKIKYNIEEEGVGMGDLLISPYLGALLYMGIGSSSMYTEELFCSVLLFFIFTSIFGFLVYLIQNVLLDKKADFLSNEMAEKSLPLVPSMVLALVVVIIGHKVFFDYLINFGDTLFEQSMNNFL